MIIDDYSWSVRSAERRHWGGGYWTMEELSVSKESKGKWSLKLLLKNKTAPTQMEGRGVWAQVLERCYRELQVDGCNWNQMNAWIGNIIRLLLLLWEITTSLLAYNNTDLFPYSSECEKSKIILTCLSDVGRTAFLQEASGNNQFPCPFSFERLPAFSWLAAVLSTTLTSASNITSPSL